MTGMLARRPVVAGMGALVICGPLLGGRGRAARAGPRETARAVVGLRVEVDPQARTARTLGSERSGSGVLIDATGLVLTIGYLILEASGIEIRAEGKVVPGEVVAYDAVSGFGLVRAAGPLGATPAPLGRSGPLAIGTTLFALARVGGLEGRPVTLVDRREFAGYWEYLLDEALFTTPPFEPFGGAVLIDESGAVVGIGSLFVADAAGKGVASPGNLFVPIDLLPPILADLLAFGRRREPPRPWLGLTLREEDGAVRILRVTEGGPAQRAGVQPGELILELAGQPVGSLAGFYRRLWALGPAGVAVPLRLHGRERVRELVVASIDRDRWLRWRPTY